MARERLLIIGGNAAGMSAASRARKRNAALEIVVLEKGLDVSYGTCGLPYLLSGRVKDPRDLVVYPADFFRQKREIDVRLGHEVTEIEPGRKIVHALHRSQPAQFHYDKIILTTGGAPSTKMPGAELKNVFTCNDLATTVRLRDYLASERPARGVIVGSGYIGLEVAEAFRAGGVETTILERSHSAAEAVDPEIAELVEQTLARNGVKLVFSAAVNSITSGADGRAAAVHYGTSGIAPAEVVLLATGVHPQVAFAQAAGIPLGPTGAIAVDERMQTQVSSIYAAGDCAETLHMVTRRPVYFPLGTTANKQGRVAGENAAGGNARFEGIVGTLVTKVFELAVARTGLSTAEAQAAGFHPESVLVRSTSRARYFNGKPIVVKLIWDRSSESLLGCQMAGEEGVAKRIDVAAMALHAGLRIPQMLHLDLSYAPPFAPVWDPLLVAVNEAYKKTHGG